VINNNAYNMGGLTLKRRGQEGDFLWEAERRICPKKEQHKSQNWRGNHWHTW
jgi:hypothetical protein